MITESSKGLNDPFFCDDRETFIFTPVEKQGKSARWAGSQELLVPASASALTKRASWSSHFPH